MNSIKRPRKRFLSALYGFLILCVVVIFSWEALSLYAEHEIARFKSGKIEEGLSTRIYSAPFILNNKSATPPPEEIIKRLVRLGYTPAPLPLNEPGHYFWKPPVLTLSLRGFNSPVFNQHFGVFSLSLNDSHWEIHDSSGAVFFQIDWDGGCPL